MNKRLARSRRVMWLLNHTTLMEWEVPMLLEMGFEVFVPKLLPVGANSRTATVTDTYDNSLTIPNRDLEYLNTINFYESPLSPKTARLINQYFGTCIAAYIFPGAYYLMRAFSGKLLLRAFGHAGDMDYERATSTVPSESLEKSHCLYTQRIRKAVNRLLHHEKYIRRVIHPNDIMEEMYACKRRLYLAAAYREIIDNELPFLQSRSLYLPLALPPSITQTAFTWRGGDPRVLFICPNIDQIDYYRRIYETFKHELGQFPYCIAGRQDLNGVATPLTTQDPNILGYQSREAYDQLLQTCSCMFYHSQEPRHLHYHPLEAMVAGMPVIFMAGGLLESCGGEDQPGRCVNYEEARAKIQRLQNGDLAFRRHICESQMKILQPFGADYCASVWRENFLPVARGEAA
jgi:hypothetical protein